jgi:hypothetical protein
MHRLIVMSLAAAGVSVGLTAATAADISPAPVFAKAPIAAAAPFSWSGFYLGAQGRRMGHDDGRRSVLCRQPYFW